MARLPRVFLPGMPHHLIQRGNNRQACFVSVADFAACILAAGIRRKKPGRNSRMGVYD